MISKHISEYRNFNQFSFRRSLNHHRKGTQKRSRITTGVTPGCLESFCHGGTRFILLICFIISLICLFTIFNCDHNREPLGKYIAPRIIRDYIEGPIIDDLESGEFGEWNVNDDSINGGNSTVCYKIVK